MFSLPVALLSIAVCALGIAKHLGAPIARPDLIFHSAQRAMNIGVGLAGLCFLLQYLGL